PAVTGVWESFRLDPEGNAGLEAAKRMTRTDAEANGEFVSWLTSARAADAASTAIPRTEPAAGRATILRVPGATPDPRVAATVLDVGGTGGVAWMTMDEGVKARFDLPEVVPTADEEERARLRAPERVVAEALEGFADFPPGDRQAARVASFNQGALASSDRAIYARRFHDITPWSEGLATNAVQGGLKGDLTLAFEREELPPSLDGRHVYSNEPDAPLAEADPYFSALADYYRLYRRDDGKMTVSVPRSHQPSQGTSGPTAQPNLAAVQGALIAPVVTRVNVVFSLVGREAHGQWAGTIPSRSRDPKRKYMVYLIYTPVVTIYNPYTVPLEVDALKVTFEYLPLAFQFFRNGRPQTQRPGLLSQFHVSSQNDTGWEDKFSAILTGRTRGSRTTPVTLKPGEARVFGVNHPPGTRWGSMVNYLWRNDLDRSKTLNMVTREGWDYNSGFIVDWLAPRGAGSAPDNVNLGVFGVRGTDKIDVAFTLQSPTYRGGPVDSFGVTVEARVNRRPTKIANYRYRYGSLGRLERAMEGGAHPSVGKIRFPVRRERPWNFNELYQANSNQTPVEKWTGPKQFALFTLADRTAHDSLYPTKPGRDASFVHQVLDMDITRTHPAQMPMELSFLPITGQGVNTVGSLEVVGANDPRSYFFSGWRLLTGLASYPTYPVPESPLLNIADLRHANLASSGHLPIPAYTVGESLAHPLLPADRAIAPGGQGYAHADHAWLANNSLWDGYYFSGLRNADEMQRFLEDGRLPLNPRIRPSVPAGESVNSVVASLEDPEAWRSSAAFLLQKGAFNVNSTSVDAWKAILSALQKAEVPLTDPVSLKARAAAAEGCAFPRMLGGPSGPMTDGVSADNQTRWAGFRDLDADQIEGLATAIVEGIRRRGPFLSMSEFVNRRLDGDAETAGAAGVLQDAIEESGVNADAADPGTRRVDANDARRFDYANPAAAEGDTQEGAASYLSQGDVLSAIGAFLTVRSDTFVIRGYGESRDRTGKVRASAICEAVVQRMPGYVDPADRADAAPDGTPAAGPESSAVPPISPVNRRFGRELRVVAFRWVAPEGV
ncbi:MAG: hypothetical protein HKO57_13880, partial [Akkermansiaceae bacterium]|nr:hypothetical protein [Akkermansiaceae bacterium]